MARRPRRASGAPRPTVRLGVTGLRQYGGYVREEFLKQLSGRRGAQTYREMRDNDDVIGAMMQAVEGILRACDWTVEPVDSEALEDIEAAEFASDCKDDLEPGWNDTLADILSFLTFGWSLHEIVYKRRADGLLGWAGFPIRSQESLLRWEWDDAADQATGMWQLPPAGGGEVMIPFSKALLFRTTTHKNNPEGRSALRNAYRSWYFKRHIEQIEGIGVERDLAGMPVMYVPKEWTDPNASDAHKALFEYAKTTVRDLKQDEQLGLVLPMVIDPETKLPLLKLELLSTGGRRQQDTGAIIARYNRGIAGTLLADFLLLGHDKVGSFALSSDKSELFEYSLNMWADAIAEQFTRKAIPDLLRLNGMQGEARLAHGPVEKLDLKTLGEFVEKIIGSGAVVPDEGLETMLRQRLDLPEREEMAQLPGAEEDTDPAEAA